MRCGKSINGALSYNEQKVKAGKADLILASGFSCDISDLNFQQKSSRFELLNERSGIKTNSMHISLNFPPGEILTNETMQQIAVNYMSRIGFSEQPYLVYEHTDTSHPHIHIVTTPIKSNGRSINIHNLVQRKSEPARKAIELEYQLVQAESRKHLQNLPISPASISPAKYGRMETKQAISNIVREVTSTYKYTSLDELNAILRHYNIIAYRGAFGSTIRQKGGLLYSIVDKDGYKIGVPIKSSSIYTGPTLKYIESKFNKNIIKKAQSQKYVSRTVNYAFTRSKTADQFTSFLQSRNIRLFVERDTQENIREIRFVDHSNRSVFNCREVDLSPSAIIDKLIKPPFVVQENTDPHKDFPVPSNQFETYNLGSNISLIANLLKTSYSPGGGGMDYSGKKKKRKRRKRP